MALTSGRCSKGWKLYQILLVYIFPLAILANLIFDFEPIDLVFSILFGVPFYMAILWKVFKEPKLDMINGIKLIANDSSN